jgi:ABC-type sugar transport system permease subunit
MFGEQQRFMLLLIAPAALLLLLFQVVPIVIGANASFRDWALYNPKKVWVGLAHYEAVLTDPAFLEVVLPNTFLFMTVSVLAPGDRLGPGDAAQPAVPRPEAGADRAAWCRSWWRR